MSRTYKKLVEVCYTEFWETHLSQIRETDEAHVFIGIVEPGTYQPVNRLCLTSLHERCGSFEVKVLLVLIWFLENISPSFPESLCMTVPHSFESDSPKAK